MYCFRGLALIIDNEDFENPMFTKRTGSMVDANNLDILFEELGRYSKITKLCSVHGRWAKM